MENKAQSFSEDRDTTGLGLMQKISHLKMEETVQLRAAGPVRDGSRNILSQKTIIQPINVCLLVLITVLVAEYIKGNKTWSSRVFEHEPPCSSCLALQ